MGGGEKDLIILVLNCRVVWWAIPSDSTEGKRSQLVSSVDWQIVCSLYAPHSTLTTAQQRGHHCFFHKWESESAEGLIHVGEVPERVSRRGRWPLGQSLLCSSRQAPLPSCDGHHIWAVVNGGIGLLGRCVGGGWTCPHSALHLWNSEQLLSWLEGKSSN